MLKVKNVISFFFIIFSLNIFSQTKLKGKYCTINKLNYFNTCITFKKKDFKYEELNDYGDKKCGEGVYTLTKDQLIINFNKSRDFKESYHQSFFYTNTSDSIFIKFEVNNWNGSLPLENVNIYNLRRRKGTLTNRKGEAVFKFKKDSLPLEISISLLGYNDHKIILNKKYNYNLNVFLSDDKFIPIKKHIRNYELLDLSKNILKLKFNNRILLLKKQIP